MMADRHQVLRIAPHDQENRTGNLTAKHVHKSVSSNPVNPIMKRAALGEVGNKLHAHTHTQNAKDLKKPSSITSQQKSVSMKPPQVLPKTKVAIKKDEVAKENKKVESKPKQMVRQESILKHFPEKKAFSSSQLVIIDPDESSKNQPQMVTEYIAEIFKYLRDLEVKFSIEKNYLENHSSTPKMRTILVNWLVEVHENFKLCIETLFLCVAIVDRYLQMSKSIGRDTLQLVGTSALLVASKYEEMYVPELSDFIYVCDYTFSGKKILQMEIEILSKLEFNLGRPLPIHFLRRYSKVAQAKNDQHTLAKYLLELMLLDYNLCHIRPSIQAAAACCLSIAILNEVVDPSSVWTPTLVHYSTYKYSDIKSVVTSIAHAIAQAETSKYDAVKKKYASSAHSKISLNAKLRGRLVKKLTSSPTPHGK